MGDIETFGFYLVPKFSAMAFMSAIEPLRVANRFSSQPVYRWRIFSADGGPVEASNGMQITTDGRIDESSSVLIVCAGFNPEAGETPELLATLRRMSRRGAVIGAMDTGTHVLAKAELIGSKRVTMHWEAIPAFEEEFPTIEVSGELFEAHDRLFTCAGGTAALDMMLHMIAGKHGGALAAAVTEQFIHERIRNSADPQRLALVARLGVRNSRILTIVEQMEKHIETPLTLEAIASRAGITRRQMERLFEIHMSMGPASYYRILRLKSAQNLILHTHMPLTDVAIATGFTSASSLSRAYRQHFGKPPNTERGH